MYSDIDSVWDQVEPEITRAIERFDIGEGVEHIRERLINRDQQLWICNGGDGVCISEIKICPDFKILAFPIIAGKNMNEWLDDLVVIAKAYAKHHQCKYIEGYGRKGWLKALNEHGFKNYSITTRLEI